MKRLVFFFALFCSLHLSAQDVNQVLITERFEEISLAKLIRKLRNRYDLKIAYDDALITGITVSGSYVNRPLPSFLDKILSDKGIDYQLLNGKIILMPKQVDLDVSTPSLFDISVFGLVQDGLTGESMPNALVRVSGSSRGTVTNKDGYFMLPEVPTDTSTIEVSYLGYDKQKVKLKPGDTKQTMTILMQQAAFELSDFTVVDNKFKTVQYGEDVSQMTIDPRNLSSVPSLGEFDIFRSLQLLPGISGTNETSAGLNIRNSPSSQNLVLFDGFTIYRLDHFFGIFSALNADAIRDLQIYKGGFGAKYGGRISGVVDITGSSGNFNEPSFNLGLNLMSARAAANIPIDGGRGAMHLSVRRAYTDIIRSGLFEKLYRNYREQSTQVQGINALENSDDFLRPDFHFFDLNFKTSYKLTERDNISFSIYNGRDDLNTDFDSPILDNNGNLEHIERLFEVAEWGNLGIGLSWSRNWASNWYSVFTAARSTHYFNYDYETETVDPNNVPLQQYNILKVNDIEDWQFNFHNDLRIGTRHNLELGANFSRLDVRNRLVINELNSALEGDMNAGIGNIFAAYVQDRAYFGKKWTISPGLRWTSTTVANRSFLAPRLQVQYQLAEKWKLKSAYGKHYQIVREEVYDDPFSLSLDGFVLSNENDPLRNNIDVMESNHFIAGLQYQNEGLTLDIEYYRKESNGLSEFNVSHIVDLNSNTRNPSVVFSQGESTIEGIDFLVQKRIKNYQGWVSYTRSKAEISLDNINNGQTLPSRQDQRNEFKWVNILELPDWNISSTWTYGTGVPFYLPQINYLTDNQGRITNYEVINTIRNVERLPDYHRLDFSVARKFGNEYISGEIGLSLLNVYNQGNIQSRRLDIAVLDELISQGQTAPNSETIFRDVVLLDFTPSFFLNISF